MTRDTILPLARAVRSTFAVAILLSALPAWAQDEAVPADPAATDAPPEAAPEAGAEAAAPTTDTIPVDQADAEAEAAAGSKDATKLDTVEVTGSRIRRTDYETAQPVLVIKREDIERTGLTSIGDILQKLPIAGTALGTSVNNGGNGSIEVDLRNLTSTRVLVLVNGRRWVNGLNSLSTSSVDLTTIPLSIIERIEVLKDGASAIYGSDAIAGVINVILRKDYVGSEWRSQLGAYNSQHGMTQSHSLSFGNVIDKTTLFIDMSFTRQEEIFNGQRDMTVEPSYGTGSSRGSGGVPAGHFQFQPTPATQSALNAVNPGNCDARSSNGAVSPLICDIITRTGTQGESFADFRPYDIVNDPYNYAPVNYLLTPNERSSVFAQIGHQLLPDVDFRTELLYNLRRSEQAIAPMPILVGDIAPPPFNTLEIDATNVFNPLGQSIGRGAGGPLTPGSGLARNRSLEYGNRQFNQDIDTLRAGFFLSGPIELASRLLSWDVGYSYAESKNKETTYGLYDLDRLGRAIGPAVNCQPPDCVPFDMFGGPEVGTITEEMLDYVSYTGVGSTRQLMRDTFANVSTELFDFFGNGPVGFALGAELREEYYSNIPDPLVQSGTSSTNRAKATQGGYDVTEFYAELAFPLVRELQYAEEIDLTLAGRSSDYSAFGKAETGKIGLRWKTLEDLMLRSTWSTAFRAPNVGELFLGNSDSFPGVLDACSNENRALNQNANDNCTEDGVPPTVVDVLGQNLQVFSGNPDLDPESAETLTAGIVYSPRFLENFNIYIDWYRIEVEDFISPLDAQYVMDGCYLSDPDERAFCQYIERDPVTGFLIQINTPFLNLPRLETEGVDVTVDYLLPWRQYGDFKFLLDGAYLTTYNRYDPTSSGETLNDDFQPGRHATLAAAFPRLKINTTLAWAQGNWTGSWSMRYIHHMMESCYDGLSPSLRDLGLCSDPDYTDDTQSQNELESVLYHGITVGYALPEWRSTVGLGVNNLFDKDPPVSYATSTIYTWEPTVYDIPGGRFTYLKFTKSF